MDKLRTVRLRFTILYALLFLGSAVVLLALTNLLSSTSETRPASGQPVPVPVEAVQSRQLLMGSLISLAIMAVVSVPLGNVVAGRVLRPLRTITAATRRISAANLHERLAVRGPADEVKNLADTIDGLLERLEASFAAQRQFVANASHELRTPLTTMRASVDVALAKPEPPPPQTVALAGRLRTQFDQVDRLLEDLLVLARTQHGALADRTPVSLKALAPKAEGVEAWTQGSPTLLARMVDNVIDNAVVHGDGWIRVATVADDATVRLIVESGGPVLDPDHVARLGRPFQRLADRTGSEKGSGLGLSIVAAIADAHGGRLDLHARPEGGLRVTISLPT
jgi:signal transduction histidine kinase